MLPRIIFRLQGSLTKYSFDGRGAHNGQMARVAHPLRRRTTHSGVGLGSVLAMSLLQCGGETEYPDAFGPGGASGLVQPGTLPSGIGGSPSTPTATGFAGTTYTFATGAAAVVPPTAGVAAGGVPSASTTNVGGKGGASTTLTTTAPSIKPAPSCTTSLNLLTTDLGPKDNWLGGDPASSIDNPCGIQGFIYAFGDAGLDGIEGNADDSCPFLDRKVSPCSNGHCCISGNTTAWPDNSTFRESIWGCGIGISLNDPDDGGGTLPYSGPVKGFTLIVSTSEAAHSFRAGYTQIATTSPAPFTEMYNGKQSVAFTDVECPDPRHWAYGASSCVKPGRSPHALQLWVVGGEVMGNFSLCIDAIYPML